MRKPSSLQAQLAAKQVSPLGVAGFLVLLALGGSLAALLSQARRPDWVSATPLVVCLIAGFYLLFARA